MSRSQPSTWRHPESMKSSICKAALFRITFLHAAMLRKQTTAPATCLIQLETSCLAQSNFVAATAVRNKVASCTEDLKNGVSMAINWHQRWQCYMSTASMKHFKVVPVVDQFGLSQWATRAYFDRVVVQSTGRYVLESTNLHPIAVIHYTHVRIWFAVPICIPT